MIVYIDRDERYPDFTLSLEHGHTDRKCEVPDETVKRWQEAISAYGQAQEEMERCQKAGEWVY